MSSLTKGTFLAVIALFIAGLALTAQNAQTLEQRVTPSEVRWPTTSGPAVGTSGLCGSAE